MPDVTLSIGNQKMAVRNEEHSMASKVNNRIPQTYLQVRCNETGIIYQVTVPTSFVPDILAGCYLCFDPDCCGCLEQVPVVREDYKGEVK